MSTDHEVKVMLLQEFSHYVGAKCVRHATVVLCPPTDVRLRVRPQQITQEPWREVRSKARRDLRREGMPTLICLSRRVKKG